MIVYVHMRISTRMILPSCTKTLYLSPFFIYVTRNWYFKSGAYRARFLSLAQSKLRLCSANHRAGYFSNLACDWLSRVWAYSEQETENGPRFITECEEMVGFLHLGILLCFAHCCFKGPIWVTLRRKCENGGHRMCRTSIFVFHKCT